MLILSSILAMANINQTPVCPEWLPGTNQVLPQGINLSREQKIKNLMRCYCEIVVPSESRCRKTKSKTQCKSRTDRWFELVFMPLMNNNFQRVPERYRIMSIEP